MFSAAGTFRALALFSIAINSILLRHSAFSENHNRTQSLNELSSKVQEKIRSVEIASWKAKSTANRWDGQSSSSSSDFFKAIVHSGRLEGFSTAQAALQAFLPVLKRLSQSERFPRSDVTAGADNLCVHHLARSIKALLTAQPWAVKMFDAWGKPGPGLVQLYGIFRGEYLECKDVQGPATSVHTDNLPSLGAAKTASNDTTLWGLFTDLVHGVFNHEESSETKPLEQNKDVEMPLFNGKYCHFGVSSNELPGERTTIKVPPITLGLVMDVCVPDSCSADDVTSLVRSVYESVTFHTDPLQIDILPAHCQEEQDWRPSAIVVVIFVGIVLTVSKFFTAYDIIFIQRPRWRRQELREKMRTEHANPGTVQSRPANSLTSPLLSDELEESGEDQDGGGTEEENLGIARQQTTRDSMYLREPKLTRLQRFAQMISIYTNGQRLLSTDVEPTTLTCLHGVRVICTAWVIMGDLLIFQMIVVENSADFYFREREKLFTMIIGNYLLAVNAFFVMSGVLLGSSFRHISEQMSKFKWIGYVVRRYFRLAPMVMMVGALYLGLWPLLGEGPVYPRNAPDQQACQKNWFFTTLLINNYIDVGDICFPWTWYIAAEFQFYLICPVFMIPLVRGWKKTGSLVALVLIAGSMVTTGVISKMKELPEIELQYELADAGIRNLADIQNYILIKPYCRIAPYIIGLLLGHTLTTNGIPRFSRIVVALGWILCIIALGGTIFGVYGSYSHHHLTTVNAAAVYNSVKDLTFGLAVAWVIFACLTENGGFINKLLSWSVFVPLSHISYCMYLIHIPVIYLFIFHLEGAITMTEWALVVNFCGVFAISAAVSAVIHVVVERPLHNIQRSLLGKPSQNDVVSS